MMKHIKTKITRKAWLIIFGVLLSTTGCLRDDFEELRDDFSINSEVSYADFDFSTTERYKVTVETKYDAKQALDGVYLEIYRENPFNAEGGMMADRGDYLVDRGVTDDRGLFDRSIVLPAYTTKLFVVPYFTGLERIVVVYLEQEKVHLTLQIFSDNINSAKKGAAAFSSPPPLEKQNGYYTLGSWDRTGTPDYLEAEDDVLSLDFLKDVNASLPEYVPLPESHPQYLAQNSGASLEIIDNCEIWATFVHEGASWKNTLGYYTYPADQPPSSVSEIQNATIIFPNVSLEEGALKPGNRVQLLYPDTAAGVFREEFPAGVSVGWVLLANGWSSSSSTVANPSFKHYSNAYLNNESDELLQQHNVLLWDEERELILIGFEDMRRDNPGCDQDFNDAVFYITSTPVNAIHNKLYQPMDSPIDSDQDGVSDVFDDFPHDPERSFSTYYPSENTFGSIVFEDLWPYRGDYDFNDLVLDYNFSLEINSSNEIISLRASLIVKAIGASYHNGFGLQLNTTPEMIASVTGQRITKGFLEIAENGTEKNQSKAVIIIFDDAFNVLPYPGSGVGVNTHADAPQVIPDTMTVDIIFNEPVNSTQLAPPPYNPFIIINGDRGVEVHLPSYPPTDLADRELFGTGDDNTNPEAGKYYISDKYLPWAINLPQSFDYPMEKEDIREAHLMFNSWALSLGYSYMDWYTDNNGYRDNSKLYKNKE
jgi:LruC domain-containing protein